jgi:predicted RNA methylase
MEQDTGKHRKNTLDQYYTKKDIAQKCVDRIIEYQNYLWIEPSAGNGSFLRALSDTIDRIAIDIDPKAPGILCADFLSWVPPKTSKKIIVFGNPPFGRQSSLAKKFIQKSAEFADVIAFILPRSFMKPSMVRSFPSVFHCVFQEELGKNSFEVEGVSKDVPCVFQVWEKKNTDRDVAAPVKECGFSYVKSGDPHDIVFRRVGGLAGKCYTGLGDYKPQSHYFWKLDEKYVVNAKKIADAVGAHQFPSNTTGPRSLSKSEANEIMNAVLASFGGT